MTEQQFIAKHKDRWKTFEDHLRQGLRGHPDQLSELYIELIDDLSYTQTHFHRSSLTQYLNQLTVAAHQQIYGTRRERSSRILSFFRIEVPEAFGRSRRFFAYACIIFIMSIGLGWLSGVLDAEFLRLILGDQYVNHTIENIDKGDPLGIYKDSAPNQMFVRISVNNVRVAFITFISGVLGGIPTVLLLLYNGVMVGAFLQFFVQYELGGIALSTIFLHGAMELTAIVIAGGTGLMLGSAVLFPGTYPRGYYVTWQARQALKIIVGVMPFIILAAVIESYVTGRYQDIPLTVKLIVILGTFVLMLYYLMSKPKAVQHEEFRL